MGSDCIDFGFGKHSEKTSIADHLDPRGQISAHPVLEGFQPGPRVCAAHNPRMQHSLERKIMDEPAR